MNMKERLIDINGKIRAAEEFVKPWHDNIQIWRDLYNFKHYRTNPKAGETHFADPTHTNTVDLAIGILLSNSKIWKAKGWKPSPNETERASQIEKFLIGVLETNVDRNEYDIDYEVLLNFVRDGGACLYTVWDEAACNEKEEGTVLTGDKLEVQEETEVLTDNPVVVQVIDPMNIYLLPGGRKRWKVTVRGESLSAYDVLVRFGTLPPSVADAKLDPLSMVKQKAPLHDYWEFEYDPATKKEKVYHAVLYNYEFVPGHEWEEAKGYKALPYIVGFYKPTDRLDSGKWHGILQPLIQVVKQLELGINRRQRQIDIFSSMPMVAKTAQGRQLKIDPGMGNVLAISQDEEIGFPLWPGNPPDVERQIDFLRSRVQQSGFSDVFYGSGSSGVSGYAVSQLGDQNRIRLRQPIVHLERFWTWVAKQLVSLVEENTNEKETKTQLQLYGNVRGELFASVINTWELSGFHIQCMIVPEFPNDKVRKHAMANQVRDILSNKRIMEEYLNVQQSDEEQDQIMMELAQKHPMMLNYAMVSEIIELAAAGDKVAQMVQPLIGQLLAAGLGGRPNQQANFEQGLGVPQTQGGMGNPDNPGNPQPFGGI